MLLTNRVRLSSLAMLFLFFVTQQLTAAQNIKKQKQQDNLVTYFNQLDNTCAGKKAALNAVLALKGTKKKLKDIANQKDFLGETPLHIAVARGWSEVVEKLISWGAELEITEKLCGESPLIATIKNFVFMPTYMVSKRAGHANEIFKKANPIHPEFLLPNPETAHVIEITGLGPVIQAYLLNNDIAIKNCVEKLNKKMEKACAKIAPKNPYFKILSLLLKAGANANKKDKFGNTALHYAIWYKAPFMALMLLIAQGGADINSKNNRGQSPLHYAKEHNSANYITFMVENGANINLQDNNGQTLMHLLVSQLNQDGKTREKIFFLETILKRCAPDLSIKDSEGQTPLDLLKEMPHTAVTDYLLCKLTPPTQVYIPPELQFNWDL